MAASGVIDYSHNCFLTVLCNVSPYARSLSPVGPSSSAHCSSYLPPRIFSGGGQPRAWLSCWRSSTTSSIPTGQSASDHAIVRRKSADALDKLTLPGAIAAAVERRQRAALRKGEEHTPSEEEAPLPRGRRTRCFTFSGGYGGSGRCSRLIMRLLHHSAPQIEELIARATTRPGGILGFIRSTTMVGLLPVPHAIVVRKYQPNTFVALVRSCFRRRLPPEPGAALFDGPKSGSSGRRSGQQPVGAASSSTRASAWWSRRDALAVRH